MKILILMRHGKSSWIHNVSDRERPLKSRGENDAKLVADEFVSRNETPGVIFSSPANRAFSTCKIFAKALKVQKDNITVIDDLYDFSGESVINFVKNLSNDFDKVMIFGHNHAFTSISNIFGDTFIDNLPTSGLVKIQFDIDDWKDLSKGTTEFIIIPKELK